MTVHVTLVSSAASTAMAEARFEAGHPLTPAGRRSARAAAAALRATARLGPGGSGAAVLVSGTARCLETARELGLRPVPVEALAGWAVGAWQGRSLAELAGESPQAVSAWLRDPAFAPPGGECLTDLCARVRGWLAEVAAGPERAAGSGTAGAGRVVAVVEPDVVRAALVAALDAGPGMFWRFDVRPLTATLLSGRGGRWNVRVGEALTAGPADFDPAEPGPAGLNPTGPGSPEPDPRERNTPCPDAPEPDTSDPDAPEPAGRG